ncbi:MAG: SRPBCC family protein [Candidatus Thorarchaeota archaeon]
MQEKPSKENTLRISRIIRAPVERVYKAFIDPDAMVKWFPPHGFTGKVTKSDVRVGGNYKMTFINFTTGTSESFGGKYLELTPNKRIRYTAQFEDPEMPEIMETTIEFRNTEAGTEVSITQKGIPPIVPIEFATMGWQESLQLLEQLVVPEIPDT